jgi:hypothetical protein
MFVMHSVLQHCHSTSVVYYAISSQCPRNRAVKFIRPSCHIATNLHRVTRKNYATVEILLRDLRNSVKFVGANYWTPVNTQHLM